MIRLRNVLMIGWVLIANQVLAQKYSVQEAIDFAVSHQISVKNSELDVSSADAKIKEILSTGLPQINSNLMYNKNLIIQKAFVPANIFNPNAKEGEVAELAFGVKNLANASVGLSQLLFDGSYLIGLKASSVYKELAVKNYKASKITVAENVSKAYYVVLVSRKQLELMKFNLERLEKLYSDTKAMFEQGFVEKIDVQRIEVQLNNLKSETENVSRSQALGEVLLKFQMGYPLDEQIVLTDNLEGVQSEFMEEISSPFDINNRIEYSILKTQENLAELNIKNFKAGYLPRLSLNTNYGYNTGRINARDIFTEKWFNNAAIGVSLQIPIFDGFNKKYKIVQANNDLKKVRQSFSLLESSIELERKQANVNLENAVSNLRQQKGNLDLANEIFAVSQEKYQEGVGSNLEVLNAQASVKESQTNYFSALYNALIAKVSLEKANGTLYNE
jgi:outer membrane protein TolC